MTAMMVCKIAMVIVIFGMGVMIAIQSYVIHDIYTELDELRLEVFRLKYGHK